MPKYSYTCNVCGHEYVEYRDINDRVWHVDCVVAGCAGKNEEIAPTPAL